MNIETKKELTAWPKKSLFWVTLNKIINRSRFGGEIDWLFCDDPNREIADFIVASFQKKKIAFVHCKYGKEAKLSASAFHDLTSQASKNLVYLRTDRIPPNIHKWNRKANWETTKIKKWISGNDSLPQKIDLWEKIQSEILNHPLGKVKVWLVMGNGMEVDKLRTKVGKNLPMCK